MKILHVEDDFSSAHLVEMYVHSTEHNIMSATTLEDAFSAMEYQPDIILLDMVLENGRDGFNFVRELRQQGYTIPVVAVTALSAHNDIEDCYNAGVDQILVKPFTIQQLAHVIQTYAQAA